MRARTAGICFTASLIFFGAGCVDVRVVAEDEKHLPDAGKSSYVSNKFISVSQKNTKNKHDYYIFTLLKGSAKLSLERPSRNDEKIVLSVPGTYTSPTDKPEGFVVLNGKIIQARERQAWNGAAFFRADGTVNIFETNNGKLLTKDYLKTVENDSASLIQGHLLVHQGSAQKMLAGTPYQRRALTLLKDGTTAIIESRDLLELSVFAEDLVELDVREAFNLDMGSWSEGWYRDPVSDDLKSIGYLQSATDRQSNWVIFTK
ncbi:MAG: phosphodiester glycosidase family protein [bacterium]